MKTVTTLVFLFLLSLLSQAQHLNWINKKMILDLNAEKQFRVKGKSKSLPYLKSYSMLVLSTDSLHNMYGDLLNDDREYNKKYPCWRPPIGVAASNLATFSIDRYIFKFDYSTSVGTSTWKHNITTGWEWDADKFGINFIGHPYSGAMFFNSARANGYNYFQSVPFAIGGSLMWEYFGENTLPSYNDIINTPISGAFLGEILYRLSSNILDDRTTGLERIIREISAGIINPVRAMNRLLQRKSFRVTSKEVYQKEPLNISLYGGIRRVNDKPNFERGVINSMFNIQLDYGNPFEIRSRKPFDFFKLRADFNFNVTKRILDNVTGYGILKGKNFQSGDKALLLGAFQYFDYWDNRTFELGAIGFGVGLINKVPVFKHSNIYSASHLGVVPFAGNTTQFISDTSLYRDYNFGGGLQTNFESTFNINKYASLKFAAYYYWIHTYIGSGGENFIGIIRPRITIRLFRNLSIGYEHFIYNSDRYSINIVRSHLSRTEQKVFLLLYLEDPKRRGSYH